MFCLFISLFLFLSLSEHLSVPLCLCSNAMYVYLKIGRDVVSIGFGLVWSEYQYKTQLICIPHCFSWARQIKHKSHL